MLLPPLPADGISDWTVFVPPQDTTTTRGWVPWQKPPGCAWIYAHVQAAGGGGGNGFTGAAGTARGGGGGGGSGGVTKIFMPAFLLPDVLYVRPGNGGAPVTNGTVSYLAVAPNTTLNNAILSIAGGGTGGTGTAAAGGTAGTAGAATAPSVFVGAGIYINNVGIVGGAGGAHTGAAGTAAVATTAPASPTTGGAGGGGTPVANTNFAGGAITAAGPWPAIAGGLAGGGAGNNGWNLNMSLIPAGKRSLPLFFSGGSGGGTNGAAGTGGAGGVAAWGCGGGGGGAGVTGGSGGRGGNGFIIIGAF
jgi:hypothetical protein